MSTPYQFDEFFSSSQEESISPFLKKKSRLWAKHLHLKSACIAAIFLFLAFIFPALANICLLFVYFLAGTPALIDACEDMLNLEINIDILMTLAAFLSCLIGAQLEGGLLLVLFSISTAMEGAVSKKTTSALIHLKEISPTFTTVINSRGELIDRSVREVTIGSLLVIKAGEIIPLDGEVSQGSSFVSLTHLTGESAPISKKEKDLVQAGSRNIDGTLTIKVLRTSEHSTLTQMIRLIKEAQGLKPKAERFLDRFGSRYALCIICLSTLFGVFTPLFFPSVPFLGNEGSIYRALTFLIAASPCALIIATPTAYLSAISACARKGILIKGGVTLDALKKCHTVAFDKTGTLTTGELTCKKIHTLNKEDLSEIDAIGIAATLEAHATHPMAKALLAFAKRKKAPSFKVDNCKVIPGFGLQATLFLNDKPLCAYIGNKELIKGKLKNNSALLPLIKETEDLMTFLLIKNNLFAFHFSDTLRATSVELLKNLKKNHHLKLAMLTGDHKKSAHKIAKTLNIDAVYSDLKPSDKITVIESLSKSGDLAMVGDGINDAPALARANVGISMGKIGSASAVDASDIVLLRDDLDLIDALFSKAKKTLSIVKQNLFLALGVILLATTPALLGEVPLWLAVILHEGGTVLVGLNSLRLLRKT